MVRRERDIDEKISEEGYQHGAEGIRGELCFGCRELCLKFAVVVSAT